MNRTSKQRIELAKKNFKQFKSPNIVAAIAAGSVGKGYADDNSDIDTVIFYKKPFTRTEYNIIVEEQKIPGVTCFTELLKPDLLYITISMVLSVILALGITGMQRN